jgi:hypothetical protein
MDCLHAGEIEFSDHLLYFVFPVHPVRYSIVEAIGIRIFYVYAAWKPYHLWSWIKKAPLMKCSSAIPMSFIYQ